MANSPFYLEKLLKNERIIGVSTRRRSCLSTQKPPLPPIPFGQLGEIVAQGFNKLGWHWKPPDVAILSEPYEGRDKCINLGPCQGVHKARNLVQM